jgi:hypothetical protein
VPAADVLPGDAELVGDLGLGAAGGKQRAGLHADAFERLAVAQSAGVAAVGGWSHTATLPASPDPVIRRSEFLLSAQALDGLLGLEEIDLGEPGRFYPAAYEAGTIAGKVYIAGELPAESMLRTDLGRFLALYDSCVDLNDELRARDPETIHTTARALRTRRPVRPKAPLFRPKSAAEYTATVRAQQQTRERRHEALLRDFGIWLQQRGLIVATNVHPRDLIVMSPSREWLVEAKVVKANAELAVREAIGQLVAYRHFFYRLEGRRDPLLVALFPKPSETRLRSC